jgi:hypothetical protein
MIHSDVVQLLPDRQFRRDLLSVRKRTTQVGSSIVLPKTGDGRHADFAPALALALSHAATTVNRSDLRIYSSGGRYADVSCHDRSFVPMNLSPLQARYAGSLGRMRSLLRIPSTVPCAAIADAIEACSDTEVIDDIGALLTRVTGCADRMEALAMLRSGRSLAVASA